MKLSSQVHQTSKKFMVIFFVEVNKSLKDSNNTLVEDFYLNESNAIKAITQTFNYLHIGNTNYAILSSYDKSWCFFQRNNGLFISH